MATRKSTTRTKRTTKAKPKASRAPKKAPSPTRTRSKAKEADAPVTQLCVVDEGPRRRILARVGEGHRAPRCVVIEGDDVTPMPGVLAVARSVNGRFVARVWRDRIDVSEGIDGAARAFAPPRLYRPMFETDAYGDRLLEVPPLHELSIEGVGVWADGSRVALATSAGVFACYPRDGGRPAITLWPNGDRLAEGLSGSAGDGEADGEDADEDNDSDGVPRLVGAHVAVSADGNFVAYGDGHGPHALLVRKETETRAVYLEPGGSVDAAPCRASFHPSRPLVALASREKGGGAVVQRDVTKLVDALRRWDKAADDEAPLDAADLVRLDTASEVLAIAGVDDGWLLGCTDGEISLVGVDGTRRGRIAKVSACRALDVSPDGATIFVGTSAGDVVELARGAGVEAREQRRWRIPAAGGGRS